MSEADVVGGIPVLSVMGTPRTMGDTIGQRLRSRLHVLSQYLLEQLAAGLQAAGRGRLDRDDLRKALKPSIDATTRLEPAVWMELESMARAADLPPEDLLLIHGHADLCGWLGSEQAFSRSTFVALNAVHTDHGLPRLVQAWHLDPTLLPYVTLVRRIPTHGPASLTLTLAGLAPIAGMNEAGLAVAANEMRVSDGTAGHLTPHLVASALTAPSREDAEERMQAGPRHGGAAIHLVAASGQRASYELSGRLAVRLPDPWNQAPRVHCNAPMADEILQVGGAHLDGTSRQRLERIAALAVEARDCTPGDVARWFRLGRDPSREASSLTDGSSPDSTVLIIADPSGKTLHLVRGGSPAGLESLSL
jgi:hypothetical protein